MTNKQILIKDATFESIQTGLSEKPNSLIPTDIGSAVINNERHFSNWHNNFLHMFGSEGYIEHTGNDNWKIVGNKKYEDYHNAISQGISDYYASKQSGQYTGD